MVNLVRIRRDVLSRERQDCRGHSCGPLDDVQQGLGYPQDPAVPHRRRDREAAVVQDPCCPAPGCSRRDR